MAARDRVADFFREKTPRRALALFIFLGALVLFRKLLITLVFFVVFERLLFVTAGFLARRFKLGRAPAFGIAFTSFAALTGLATWLSAGRVARLIVETRETLPARLESIKENELFLALQEHLPDGEQLAEKLSHYGTELAQSAAGLGHFVIAFVIGLVLAIVFYFDEEKVRAFRATLDPKSLTGTLALWLEHTTEAVSLTVQLQLIVAGVNAVLTLPVLLLIGVPHVPALMLLIFISGLIPVIGNIVSGAVLCLVAYQVKGVFGVGLFIGLTFVLHKIESYFLNPRLTSRHVKLPGFLLIMSLIAWEHLLGISGLFLSFPILYVSGKILAQFREEDAPTVEAAPAAAPETPAKTG
jgi:predicted PurR-regulated permease PerM